MIDIYSFDFINWLKDTNIYKWYSELFSIKSKSETIIENNTEKSEDVGIPSFMRSSDKNSTTNETTNERDYEIIKRIKQIIPKRDFNDDPVIIQVDEIEEDIPFYKNKYWIIGAGSLICLVGWYYYGDNITPVINSGIEKIKTGYGAIIDYLSSFRSTPPDDTGGSNSSGSTLSDKLNIKKKLDRYFKTTDLRIIDKTPDARIIGDAGSEIEILDNVQPIASSSNLDKGKGVLTSPSLEDLNLQAAETWASGSSSPGSESSSSTITPIKIELPENKDSVLAEFIPESPIPLEYVTKNWKLMFPTNIKDKIKVMDHIWYDNEDISKDQADTLADSLAYLIAEYNKSIHNFNTSLTNLQPHDIRASRQSFYHFRHFLSFYYERVLPNEDNPIIIGSLSDELKELPLQ
jgi:hypothetical protein